MEVLPAISRSLFLLEILRVFSRFSRFFIFILSSSVKNRICILWNSNIFFNNNNNNNCIDHIVSGCSKLAQKEYKRRHDNLGKIVHWKLARKCNFEAEDKWYEHEPESVSKNEDYKILWDISIQTDHVIEARRPDLVVVDKKERSCKIIGFAVPGDSRIEEKEKDKIEKYQELGRELQKIWNVKVKIIPLVVGSLGAIPKQFGNRLKQIGIAVGTAQVQKTVLLGTAGILKKVLEI